MDSFCFGRHQLTTVGWWSPYIEFRLVKNRAIPTHKILNKIRLWGKTRTQNKVFLEFTSTLADVNSAR